MSELKAFNMPRYAGQFTLHEVYLKSDADKVIAELKQKINEAQTELELWRDGSIISEAHQKELDGKRHSDYKRCSAMVKMCKARYVVEDVRVNSHCASWDYTESEEMKYWERWQKRWMELAEKFKDGE